MDRERIRDPLHGLVGFGESELEKVLWRAVQTRPFQRLRRIKQLGFSDLVYPGATHSRLAHSIGVFHTARQLMEIVRNYVHEDTKERQALAAALLHDVGHGPFSHAFEKVGKRLGLKLASHETVSDLLIRDSEISAVLNEMGSGFANDVANVVQKGGVKTVHHAVVSSQFDADRLDYMRRDRLMTGTQHAAIDFPWLLANLEIGSVKIGIDDTPLGAVDTFVLGHKAIYAAEAFVLGLFQLYPTVYFHKATRGAEQVFAELLVRVVELAQDGSTKLTGLPASHPLIKFAKHPEEIEAALALDDTVVWGALTQMGAALDPLVSNFAIRLRDRKLFRSVDIRSMVAHAFDPKNSNAPALVARIDRCCVAIRDRLTDWDANNRVAVPRVLLDEDERSPYKPIGQSKGPLDRINVTTAGGSLMDLNELSTVVSSLQKFKLMRAYVSRDDTSALEQVEAAVNEEIAQCPE